MKNYSSLITISLNDDHMFYICFAFRYLYPIPVNITINITATHLLRDRDLV